MLENEVEKSDIPKETENIFNEFTENINLKKEVEKIEEKSKKDMYYYLKHSNSVLFSMNVLAAFLLILFSAYYFVQNSQNREFSFLSPICAVFLWSAHRDIWGCSGIVKALAESEEKLKLHQDMQVEMITPILWDVYTLENFNLSPKVTFLLDKTENRVRPTEILKSFDEIKNSYSPIDKQEILCYDLEISSERILSLSCDVFSSDWDTKILSLKDGVSTIIPWWGTSITRASSFIHFIENTTDSPFRIIASPDSLSSVNVSSWPYTLKTNISLQLEYFNPESLTF